MNITLSIDEKLVKEARAVAARMGKSLNQLIREDLQRVASMQEISTFDEFLGLSGKGNSHNSKISRDSLYERT
jgi:antitoxin component of RelBE/YafQ-DinJ toxin-antitoxin module